MSVATRSALYSRSEPLRLGLGLGLGLGVRVRPHLVAMAQRAVLPPLHPVAAAPHHTLRARVPHVDAPCDLFRATARAGATARVRVGLGGEGATAGATIGSKG